MLISNLFAELCKMKMSTTAWYDLHSWQRFLKFLFAGLILSFTDKWWCIKLCLDDKNILIQKCARILINNKENISFIKKYFIWYEWILAHIYHLTLQTSTLKLKIYFSQALSKTTLFYSEFINLGQEAYV